MNTDKELLNLLLEAIDYSFLQTDGSYDDSLTHPVIDKVRFIKEMMRQPSLPSDLDEAAVQAHIRLEEGEGLSFLNIFKAGAEWMAGQGFSVEGVADGTGDDVVALKYEHHSISKKLSDYFKPGDKVIAQFRKKNTE